MSLTYTSQVGKTAARFGVQHIPGRMAVAKIQHDLTPNMLPKSQVPRTGRIDPVPVKPLKAALDKVMFPIMRLNYRTSHQAEYGLRFDDWWFNQSNDPDVGIALSRIDDIELQLRNFRGFRAAQLAIERSVAPKEERFSEILEDSRYCKPWYDQVMREKAEAASWDNY